MACVVIMLYFMNYLERKYTQIFVRSACIICSGERTVILELRSRKTASFEEQIMSKDKYGGTFSGKMKAIELIIFQIFFVTHAILKFGKYKIISNMPWF